ncbi:MAG: glycosyltransferase family 39 protein [Chloroflexi bacterium]|nr:glycosyltransferase family 39 protein [Chloroflexota bacterium]
MRWLWLIFALAVLARISGQVALGAYAHPRLFEYEEIATNLINGRGYTYASPDGGTYVASQSSPLYILLTAGVYLVTGHSQPAMLLLQAALGGLTAVLVAWAGRRAFSRSAGMVAGGLVAIDPGLVVYAAELHSLSLDALANVGLVCATLALPARPGRARLAGLGAVFGLAGLTRATALLLLPVHLVWLRLHRGARLMSIGAAVAVLAMLLVYAAWPVRNSLLLGQLTLGSSETTEWLWRGNNPNANGGSLTPDGERMLAVAPPAFRAEIEAASEAQRVRVYQAAAFEFIRANPASASRLYVTKLLTFWWGSQETGLLYPPTWVIAYQVWYAAILLCAGLGMWSTRAVGEQRGVVWLIVATLVLVSLTQAIFYVEGRHRLAVEPLLLIVTGVGVADLATRVQCFWTRRVSSRDRRPPGGPRARLRAAGCPRRP